MKKNAKKRTDVSSKKKMKSIVNDRDTVHFHERSFETKIHWIDLDIEEGIRYKISGYIKCEKDENEDAFLLMFDFSNQTMEREHLKIFGLTRSNIGIYAYLPISNNGGITVWSYILPIMKKTQKVKLGFRSWQNKHKGLFSTQIQLEKESIFDTIYNHESIVVKRLEKNIHTLDEKLLKQELEHKININKVNLKYRHQVNTVVPYLKDELKRLGFKSKQAETGYKYKLEQTNQKVRNAQEQVTKTRATLSFQFGYQLAHSFKPWYNIFLLPIHFSKIIINHRRKKKEKIRIKGIQTIKPSIQTVEAKHKIQHTVPNSVNKLSKQHPFELGKIKMACIMDEFTYSSYMYECDLCQLTPNAWKSELESFQPEVLFIESAWRGKDDLWGSKVGHNAQELKDIILWCNSQNIPTLFWNKEDPIHFETFLNTAQQFDYVFTTDIDCINKYKGSLGHERVYLLPFAAQPAVNNPIEKYTRKDAFCFAGAYYVRYPDRTRDLGNFVAHLPELKSLEIYDRNYGKDDVNYMFPDEYKPFIVGTLKHSEIDKAYKGYNYAINLNSIKQSQTMFARRIFELLASNTISVSNFSRGIRLLFGDLVFTSDSGEEILTRLRKLNTSAEDVKKLRLLALRKVMKEHTYQDRFAYIISKLQDEPIRQLLPNIALVVHIKSQKNLESIVGEFDNQSYEYKHLYMVVPKLLMRKIVKALKSEKNITVIAESEAKKRKLNELIKEDWITHIVEEDYYGANYVTDLALSTRYTDATVIGKASYFSYEKSKVLLNNPKNQYLLSKELNASSSMIQRGNLKDISLLQWLNFSVFKEEKMFSIDEFNYCKHGKNSGEDILERVTDMQEVNLGLGLKELVRRSEEIDAIEELQDKDPIWDVQTLSELFKTPASKNVVFESDGIVFDVHSKLEDSKHEYIYARKDFTLKELGYTDKVKYYLDATPGLNIQVVTFFLDENNQKISHAIKTSNRNQEIDIPVGTEKVRFGLRIYAGGTASIKAFVLGHRPTVPGDVLGSGEHLVLTNHYPSYEDIYRNGFVHSRVKAYKESGLEVDVFRLRKDESLSYHEFQDVDVVTGSQEALKKMLSSGKYKNVLVHFLDEDMWEVLQEFIDDLEVIVWIHGSEIQPWHRRDFNYSTEDERNDAKKKSDVRMTFWRSILEEPHSNLKLIFVSHSFANDIMEDLGFKLPEAAYSIIHNYINTEIFDCHEKSIEQRKRILSIRPYASKTYANDLSVKTILLLSEMSWFSELEFKMIGDGALFDEILEPVKHFRNVSIERGFLTQSQIADLHKQYGIFLVPTRADTQGVSRDEAMSSGLVPVTNAVAAIPEFVDDTCGILAPGDDAYAMAEGIKRLYYEEDLFCIMSEKAANRIRKQTSFEYTIKREISLIRHERILNDR